MITVSYQMNATADRFYDLLMNSVKYDIEQKTGTDVDLRDIKSGYVYKTRLTNKLGRKGVAKATLTKIEHPYCYEAQFETPRGVNTISYHIKDLDDDVIEITYSEQYASGSAAVTLNFKIMSFFYKRSTRRKMFYILNQMDRYLQSTQEEENKNIFEE